MFSFAFSDSIFSDGDDAQSLSDFVYSLTDHEPDVVDVVMWSETIQPSRHAETPTESPGDAFSLYPDTYPDYDTSDEEMEEATPGDSSTTATTSSPVPQLENIRCLWQGCRTEFEPTIDHGILKDHLVAHAELRDGNRSERLDRFKCRWNGCNQDPRKSKIISHMSNHALKIQRPCPYGCGKTFKGLAQHMKCCPMKPQEVPSQVFLR